MHFTTKFLLEHGDDLAVRAGMEAAYRGVENVIADDIREKRWGSRRLFETDWKRRFQDGRLKAAATRTWIPEVIVDRVHGEPVPSQCYWNGPVATLERIESRLRGIERFVFVFVARNMARTETKLRAAALKGILAEYEKISFEVRKVAPSMPKGMADRLASIAELERVIRSLAKKALEMVAPAPKAAKEITKSADEAEGRPCDAPDWKVDF